MAGSGGFRRKHSVIGQDQQRTATSEKFRHTLTFRMGYYDVSTLEERELKLNYTLGCSEEEYAKSDSWILR
jgi:hypothetical protein